tara:strand:- start:1166 stop:2071 length:906 start_codon:yes stop_codon:yes gene_type:complete
MRLRTTVALIVVTGAVLAGVSCGAILTASETSAIAAPVSVQSDLPRIGGLSGIEVLAGGDQFIGLSDRGFLVFGRLIRQNGRLTEAHVDSRLDFPAPDGSTDPMGAGDSEGLAHDKDGRLTISLEQNNAVWRIEDDGLTTQLPDPPETGRLIPNGKYEALAVDDSGALYTLPETAIEKRRFVPLWRLDGEVWSRVRDVPVIDNFHPVGADFGPDGAFYLLERAFGLGFSNQIRRFDLSDPSDPGRVIWRTDEHLRANFEGLSVWQDATGRTMLTMVSDDNFLPLLESAILEISLDSLGPSR